ncbi:MAG: EAL domain-containing protein [Pseudomonadota bacterium]
MASPAEQPGLQRLCAQSLPLGPGRACCPAPLYIPPDPAQAVPGYVAAFACAVLDAEPEQMAVLSFEGRIVAVNEAWRRFGQATRPGDACALLQGRVGSDYLEACRHSDCAGADASRAAAAGIAAVLAGTLPCFEFDYACPTLGGQRWYSLHAVPLRYGWRGAVIKHRDISARRQNEADLRVAAIAFESPEGMMITDAHARIVQVNQAFTTITGYSKMEAIGQNPSMLSSGRHDKEFYRRLWHQVHTRDGWEGEIWNRRKNGEIYPEHLTIATVRDINGTATHYVASLADITLSKAATDEIKNLAFYDPLTHLPNRRLLLDRLQQALVTVGATGKAGALMFIDLDDFKILNDTLGHPVGDQLLQQVGARLLNCVRDSDTVARLGGDEFVVLLEDLGYHGEEVATQTRVVADKILGALNRPFQLGEHLCLSTPSIGATLLQDRHSRPDELLRQADIAMYQAKRSGRNALRFFDQQMQDAVTRRAALEEQLRHAAELGQLELYYQAQVDAQAGIIGAECLVRWRKPGAGLVGPDDFIPLAEENGMIIGIGNWVLDEACRQLARWQHDPRRRDLVLAVNVSARQFRQAGFGATVRQAIARHAIDPSRLKLELTESLLLENPDETIVAMTALKALGITFSLDDFGTGYSSLQYLKRLPLDQLKIDRAFVRDLAGDGSDQAIVRTIIAMAHSLNLAVIAEGVETAAQRAALAELGCQHYQGYLFSKPVPVAAFELLL